MGFPVKTVNLNLRGAFFRAFEGGEGGSDSNASAASKVSSVFHSLEHDFRLYDANGKPLPGHVDPNRVESNVLLHLDPLLARTLQLSAVNVPFKSVLPKISFDLLYQSFTRVYDLEKLQYEELKKRYAYLLSESRFKFASFVINFSKLAQNTILQDVGVEMIAQAVKNFVVKFFEEVMGVRVLYLILHLDESAPHFHGLTTNLRSYNFYFRGPKELLKDPVFEKSCQVLFLSDQKERLANGLFKSLTGTFSSDKDVAKKSPYRFPFSFLQDVTFYAFKWLGFERGKSKEERLKEGVPKWMLIARDVKTLHEDLPREIELKKQELQAIVEEVQKYASRKEFLEKEKTLLEKLLEEKKALLEKVSEGLKEVLRREDEILRREGELFYKEKELLEREAFLEAREKNLKEEKERLEEERERVKRSQEAIQKEKDEVQKKANELLTKEKVLALKEEKVNLEKKRVEETKAYVEEKLALIKAEEQKVVRDKEELNRRLDELKDLERKVKEQADAIKSEVEVLAETKRVLQKEVEELTAKKLEVEENLSWGQKILSEVERKLKEVSILAVDLEPKLRNYKKTLEETEAWLKCLTQDEREERELVDALKVLSKASSIGEVYEVDELLRKKSKLYFLATTLRDYVEALRRGERVEGLHVNLSFVDANEVSKVKADVARSLTLLEKIRRLNEELREST